MARVSQQQPIPAISTGFKSYFTFRAVGQDCAIESRLVRAIVPGAEWLCLTPFTPNPLKKDAFAKGTLPGILGLSRFQGRELVVIDLAKALGVPPVETQPALATLVIVNDAARSQAAEYKAAECQKNAPPPFGFWVEHVSDILTYHQRDLYTDNRGEVWLMGQGRRRRAIEWQTLTGAVDWTLLGDFRRLEDWTPAFSAADFR